MVRYVCDTFLIISIFTAPGESAMIAEEMAARDALRNIFGFHDSAKPLPFGKEFQKLKVKSTPNPTLEEWKSANIFVV